jgi:hypothetical protein
MNYYDLSAFGGRRSSSLSHRLIDAGGGGGTTLPPPFLPTPSDATFPPHGRTTPRTSPRTASRRSSAFTRECTRSSFVCVADSRNLLARAAAGVDQTVREARRAPSSERG